MPSAADLFALSPLDGRYRSITDPLRNHFSEAAHLAARVNIEIDYLLALSHKKIIRPLSPAESKRLTNLKVKPSDARLQKIKALESATHHDVKAIEYYVSQQFVKSSLKNLVPFIHFGLTSEDVNNLAERRAVQTAHTQIMTPAVNGLLVKLGGLIFQYHALPMLARTHGQPAIPTTFGKELAVFAQRLLELSRNFPPLTGKLNGAVGNFSAHRLAFPNINWLQFASSFISSQGLTPKLITTQINSGDDLIRFLHQYHQLNQVLIGLCQDLWRYISDGWLTQTGKTKFVGSSTMPQKINPIEFENAEGNLTLANGLIETLSRKLSVSRLQRDLSDSTVKRNLGVVFGHSLIGYHSLNRGLNSIAPNQTKMAADLNQNYAILGEALQTVLRKQGQSNAYESVAKAFKTKQLSQKEWQKITRQIAPTLIALTPSTYLGYASPLALSVASNIKELNL